MGNLRKLIERGEESIPFDIPPHSVSPDSISTEGGSERDVLVISNGVATWSRVTVEVSNILDAIGVANGGTGITNYTAGDMLYASNTNILSKLPIGASNRALFSNGTTPNWRRITAADVDAGIFPGASYTMTKLGITNSVVFTETSEPSDGSVDANTIALYAIDLSDLTALRLKDSNNFVVQLARDSVRRARNASGNDVDAGVLVAWTSPPTGDVPNFVLADASDPTLEVQAITAEPIVKNTIRHVMSSGVLRGIKTNYVGWTAGDTLYASATTPGAITNVRPAHPNLNQVIGTLSRVHPNDGIIDVDIRTAHGDSLGTRQNEYKIGNGVDGDKLLTFSGLTTRTLTMATSTGLLTFPAGIKATEGTFTSGNLWVGVDDATPGTISVFGPAVGDSGARIDLYVSAAHPSVNVWSIETQETGLRVRAVSTEIGRWAAGGGLHIGTTYTAPPAGGLRTEGELFSEANNLTLGSGVDGDKTITFDGASDRVVTMATATGLLTLPGGVVATSGKFSAQLFQIGAGRNIAAADTNLIFGNYPEAGEYQQIYWSFNDQKFIATTNFHTTGLLSGVKLGINATPTANVLTHIAGSVTGTTAGYGMFFAPTITAGQNNSSLFGLAWGGTFDAATFTGTTGVAVNVSPATNVSAGNFVEFHHLRIQSGSHSGTITTLYGLNIANITGGVTNYAIYTGTGLVRFGGLVTADAGLTVASGQTLTVSGATITGLTAASVGAGTFPAGGHAFTGLLTANAGLKVAWSGDPTNEYLEIGGSSTSEWGYNITGAGSPLHRFYDPMQLDSTLVVSGLLTASAGLSSTFIRGATNTASVTGSDANDYAIGDYTTLRVSVDVAAPPRAITGFAGGADGRLLVLRNVDAIAFRLTHQDGASAAVNRIVTASAGDQIFAQNDGALLQYYDSRWHLLGFLRPRYDQLSLAGAKMLDTTGLFVSGTKVVGSQGLAVADATGGTVIDAEARTAINALLARVRTHGLIAT